MEKLRKLFLVSEFRRVPVYWRGMTCPDRLVQDEGLVPMQLGVSGAANLIFRDLIKALRQVSNSEAVGTSDEDPRYTDTTSVARISRTSRWWV